jgi:hypothetical protein
MPDQSFPDDHSANPKREPATELPGSETQQPDPLLQVSAGRIGAGGIAIAGVVVAIIVGVVLYGLNNRTSAESAAAPPSTAAGQQPAAGGNSGARTPGAPRANESGVKG